MHAGGVCAVDAGIDASAPAVLRGCVPMLRSCYLVVANRRWAVEVYGVVPSTSWLGEWVCCSCPGTETSSLELLHTCDDGDWWPNAAGAPLPLSRCDLVVMPLCRCACRATVVSTVPASSVSVTSVQSRIQCTNRWLIELLVRRGITDHLRSCMLVVSIACQR
jgi:hypothetical protein